MASFRYILLIALTLAIAVAAVLWQEDDTPTITFKRPPVDIEDEVEDVSESAPTGLDSLANDQSSAIVPLTEPLRQPHQSPEGALANRGGLIAEQAMTEEQLAAQINLAKQNLARVEALNAKKQALIAKALEQESSAELSLLEAELAYRIDGWKQAWQAGDSNSYFNFYSDDFRPNHGHSLDKWKAQRLQRLSPKQPINIELSDFKVEYDAQTNRSLVTFEQFYESGDYQDRSQKRLILANEQGQWKIISETTQ